MSDSLRASGSEVYVTAVMPCLNEERTLGLCIEKAQRAFREMGIVGEVVVADNGSTDRSVEIAESLGARVAHEPRKGYGSALMAGINAARGRVVVMADADDSYDWLSLGDFVGKIEQGYDLVMGNRFKGGIEPGAMPALHRYFGNPVLSTLARVMYRIPIADFHCGMRAFTREAFDRMSVRTTGMEFATEMVVNASHAGLRIAEIPTRLYPDKRDRAPHLRSFRDGWRHLRFMLSYAPDWLYLVPGLTMALLGLSGMAALAGGPVSLGGFPMGIHFLAVFSLLAILGSNVVGFGVFAKLVNEARCPIAPRSILGRLLRVFTLERGLLAGLSLMLGGFAVILAILAEWLARGRGDMTETVHLAFLATTVIVLGVNLLFGAFLLYLLRDMSHECERADGFRRDPSHG
ncbi:MAG: glycosyltransferase family 2 protein [Betaproteobacteria bacterium]|nr:glycosyltransferase family 2 protein [Betaproteobacteria bacterium]